MVVYLMCCSCHDLVLSCPRSFLFATWFSNQMTMYPPRQGQQLEYQLQWIKIRTYTFTSVIFCQQCHTSYLDEDHGMIVTARFPSAINQASLQWLFRSVLAHWNDTDSSSQRIHDQASQYKQNINKCLMSFFARPTA